MAQIDLNIGEVLGASAAVPIGMVGTEIIAENAPTIEVFGVNLFGQSVLDETLGRLLVGAVAALIFAVLDITGVLPEEVGGITDPRLLIESVLWGLIIGSVASAFMELYTFFGGSYTFEEAEVMYPETQTPEQGGGVPSDELINGVTL